MKKILMIISLFGMLNLFANPESQKQPHINNLKENEINSIEFEKLSNAINKIDFLEVQSLASDLKLGEVQKNALLNKINSMIRAKRKSYLLNLIAGLPLAVIGYHFFYGCYHLRDEIYADNKSGNIGFEFIKKLKEILYDDLIRLNFRVVNKTIDANNLVKIQVVYDVSAILLATACALFGTKFTIEGLKTYFSQKIQNLKLIRQIVTNISVTI